jgi:precorrin-6B methylase 2
MRSGRVFRVLACSMVVIALSCAPAPAQQTQAPAKPYEPSVGQEGKDVVWVPTPDALVNKMLDMAATTPNDFVIDLGSGDGRTVIAAAQRGARALGIEYNPDMVELSKRRAAQAGVGDKAAFMKADLFETDLSKATVITMFLLPSINIQLRPKLLDLKPGTRIVSNTFTMEDWEADETVHVTDGCTGSWCTALFWVVPAKVEGTWETPQGNLTLTQQFQKVSGTLGSTPVSGRLRGDEITLDAGKVQYTGRVNGKTIQGRVKGGAGGTFTATRK